jgi:CheY-like chemotaxis protein
MSPVHRILVVDDVELNRLLPSAAAAASSRR